MRIVALACIMFCSALFAEDLAPKVNPLSQAELGVWVGKIHPKKKIEKSIIRRGLISGQTGLRADCAMYLVYHGDQSDIPHLIDALSDESSHVGGRPEYMGMSTTRYWANVALICICKVDLGYRWDDTIEKRKKHIESWKNHWRNVKTRIKQKG